MGEQNTGGEATTEQHNEQVTEQTEFEAITSQEEFDKRIQSRIARERGKFADYDELKAQAEKFREFEESQKTEDQKRQERDAERDRELTELRSERLRSTIAAEKSDPENGVHVPAELLTGTTREELEASADALIKFKGDTAQKPRVVVTREGRRPSSKTGSPETEAKREWLADLNGDDA